MSSNSRFNPDFGLAFQGAENIGRPPLDSPWIFPQHTSTTVPSSLHVEAPQPTLDSIPYDSVPTFMNWATWGSSELLGSGMQNVNVDSISQTYHVGKDLLPADFGIDPHQDPFNESLLRFSPAQQDSLPNLEFHNDLRGAETWVMTTGPPVINTLQFSPPDTGSSSMSDMSSDFERQLTTTVQMSPSVQSQCTNDSATLTRILEGSLGADNGLGFECSDIREYEVGAGEESREYRYILDMK
jgi:hypothetical protein